MEALREGEYPRENGLKYGGRGGLRGSDGGCLEKKEGRKEESHSFISILRFFFHGREVEKEGEKNSCAFPPLSLFFSSLGWHPCQFCDVFAASDGILKGTDPKA